MIRINKPPVILNKRPFRWPWIFDFFLKTPRVDLKFSSEPYFVGSYQKIKVDIRNITFDELQFNIIEGASGGYISHCRDATFNINDPDIMICFGYRPGKYHLEVRKSADGALLNTFEFAVDTVWKDEKRGPGISFTGISENISYNAAWGGGISTPQNLNVVPANGVRRIAMILIDFADARYPTDAPTLTSIRNRWMNEAVNGINNAGRTESARQFYREVSYNNYDLTATIFGPVSFTNNWADNFKIADKEGAPKNAFWQQAITACDSVVNYNDFDNLIFISEAWTDSDGIVKNAWPYGGSGTFTTAEGNKNLGIVSMPREWGAGFRGDRTVRSTIVHELGHSLGLGDQYKPDTGRNVGNWDPMSHENNLPHFSIAHRMMLGWVQGSWLKTYNFATGGGVVNETITVSPIERGAPPAGLRAGIEIRIADGVNYYVEYRSGQSTHIGDRALDTRDAILITDVDSTPEDAPISRPNIILVHNDEDNDGSVLIDGKDYKETDSSDYTYPTDFKLSVSGITADKADVKIEYGVSSKPDPSIRPWPASASRQWQSPDIEVQNTRNIADPANWFNVPWAGNPNTVIAKVKNNGNLAAPGVRVEFYVKNFNVGGSPETFLGADTKDLPAQGVVNFTTSWNPPGNGHYCVVVRIPGYMSPGPNPVLEMSIFNNLAQSNYTRFISASASPASREMTEVEVGNPYKEPTTVFIRPGQTNPLYRTYLEYTSVYLQPAETRKVKMMFEFDPELVYKIPVSLGKKDSINIHDPKDNERGKIREIINKYHAVPNKVGVVGYIDNPSEKHPHTPSRLSGVEAEIVTGKKTQILRYFREDHEVGGIVMSSEGTGGVDTGKIILMKDIDDGEKVYRENEVISLDSGGSFRQKLWPNKGKIVSVQAYYLPGPGFGDCYSEKK